MFLRVANDNEFDGETRELVRSLSKRMSQRFIEQPNGVDDLEKGKDRYNESESSVSELDFSVKGECLFLQCVT